jgi:hypothetical protein
MVHPGGGKHRNDRPRGLGFAHPGLVSNGAGIRVRGILYFVDLEGNSRQYEWDMKLWWPHNEAIYATLLAFADGRPEIRAVVRAILAWSMALPGPPAREWFGHLHRDGSLPMT